MLKGRFTAKETGTLNKSHGIMTENHGYFEASPERLDQPGDCKSQKWICEYDTNGLLKGYSEVAVAKCRP